MLEIFWYTSGAVQIAGFTAHFRGVMLRVYCLSARGLFCKILQSCQSRSPTPLSECFALDQNAEDAVFFAAADCADMQKTAFR